MLCTNCGERMRLARVEPDFRYINVDVACYNCKCGLETSAMVARADNRVEAHGSE